VAWTASSSNTTPGTTTPATEQLVWSDEFTGTQGQSAPDPTKWTYETGAGIWGNQELETYCSYGSNTAPCSAAQPNSYVGSDGYLHIVGRVNAQGQYTSARLTTQRLASFQYGRIEARIQIPAGQGMWPAFWMLGDSIGSTPWPACGEMDIMENVGKEPATIHGSIHGVGFIGSRIGLPYTLPDNVPFSSGFHTFGMLWSPGKVQYYVDDPSNVFAIFTPASLPTGAIWPFDSGKFFFLLNLAIGGDWPGPPGASTQFPAEVLVDYVRVWQEPAPTASLQGAWNLQRSSRNYKLPGTVPGQSATSAEAFAEGKIRSRFMSVVQP
jgi:beta-glucanase (GH16 family)